MNKIVITLFIPLLLLCAHQQSPSGGKTDKTPPSIVSIYPSKEAVNVNTDSEISIKWSEWIDRRNFENMFFYSPLNLGKPHFKWRGAYCKISFDSSFQKNTTYFFSISSNTKDLHGVALKEPISWAFSTGEILSRGYINGKILNSNTRNLIAIAYNIKSDSVLLPYINTPSYIVSADKNGLFRFKFMNKGKYRVFAFTDNNMDRKFQLGKEPIAIPYTDIYTTTDSLQKDNFLVLSQSNQDTMGVKLNSAELINYRTLKLTFSDDILFQSAKNTKLYKITIPDDSSNTKLTVSGVSMGDNKREITLVTNYHKPSKTYKIDVSGLLDLHGDFIKTGNDTANYYCWVKRDTTTPKISSIKPSLRNDIMPNDSIVIHFSEPINSYYLKKLLNLSDSAKNNIEIKYTEYDFMHVVIKPKTALQTGKTYKLSLYPGALTDMFRNRNRDTITYKIRVLKLDDITRTINGNILSSDTCPTILVWKNLRTNRKFEFKIKGSTYSMDGMPQGKYLLTGYKDKNNNGVYDSGTLLPFSFSEPISVYPDTLTFRGRWELNDINLKF